MISSLWSRDGNLDNTSNVTFQQNHFVFLNVRDSGWRIAGKKTQVQWRPFEWATIFTPKESFPAKHHYQKQFQLTLKQILLHVAWPCVPSQSIPEDIPVTHTITYGVKPLETMNDEMKNTIITNRVPSKVINSHQRNMWTKKKKGFWRRSCQHQWFPQFDFISYSTNGDGVYCLACVFFPKEGLRSKQLIF